MARLDITEVTSGTGLPASTLRYYEERGLIASCGREGGRRQFDDQVLQRIALISLGQAAGFSLAEIETMIDDDGEPDIDRAALLAKADEIDRKVEHLTAMRDGLLHAAECPAPSYMECPTFQRLLAAATTRSFGARVVVAGSGT